MAKKTTTLSHKDMKKGRLIKKYFHRKGAKYARTPKPKRCCYRLRRVA